MTAVEIDFTGMRKGTRIGREKRIVICARCGKKGIAIRRSLLGQGGRVAVSVYHRVKLIGPRTRLGISITDRCAWVEDGAE